MGKKIFLNTLPTKEGIGALKGKEVIDWISSIGCKVKGTYNNIDFEVEIIDYEKQYVFLKYKDKDIFKIHIGSFIKCCLGNLLGEITNEFKIGIGQAFKDDKRDITITNRKKVGSWKYYKYKCNKCSFECGGHYKNGEYKEEYWIEENNLLSGKGCSVCCNSPRIVVPEINSIVADQETHWMIPYFQGGYDEAKKYTKTSGQEIYPICPDCGRVKDKEISISTIYTFKSIGCYCNNNYYPESLMLCFLNQFNIQIITQLSKTTFKWCEKYKYDFYFELNNEGYIVETHGNQHYEDAWDKVEKTQANDKIKKELAIQNGIKEDNYIIIDCRKSELNWIKESILKSKITELFELSNIDWIKCEEFVFNKKIISEVCSYWNNKNECETTKDICKIFNIGATKCLNILKLGAETGLCNYSSKEEMNKVLQKGRKLKSKKIEVFKDEISLGIFESAMELTRQSEELFGVIFHNSLIAKVCRGERKHHNGYVFKYLIE